LTVAACGSSGGGGSDGPSFTPADFALPVTPDTWTDFANAFFSTYCDSCHTPGGQAAQQNFQMYSVVLANAATIRCGVAPAGQTQSGCGPDPAAGQFPIGNGPKPSAAERLRLIAWIDAGTPH
jgi:hypothetical protein